mgnify:CR=1 FL=1
MGILSWLFGHQAIEDPMSGELHSIAMPAPDVNPATGLPMMDETFDVMGNAYGLGEPGGVAVDDGLSPGFGDDG